MPCDGLPRCHEPITDEHLHRLADLALSQFEGLFIRRPRDSGRYWGHLLMLTLCQGAARHRLDGQHDVRLLLPTRPVPFHAA